MRYGIIGGTGWLGSALGQRLLSQGIVAAQDLCISNRSGPQADYHGHRVQWCADAADLAARCDVIVVSVRPESWPALNLQAKGKLVISFMAGVEAAVLSRSGGRIIRAMPNAAAETGQSYSPFWADSAVTEDDRQMARRLLSAIGTTDELPQESQIDLMTALPGSGAAYPALMAVAMAEFMMRHDVPETIAWRATEAAVCGGAALLAGQPERARALLAAYRDYRGTTAAGIDAAEAAGFAAALDAALDAATRKARQMAEVARG